MVSDPLAIQSPVLSDSFNIFGNKYDLQQILKTQISPTAFQHGAVLIQADPATGYITGKSLPGETSFSFFNLAVTAERYTKAKLKVTSAQAFEVYIDGKKVSDKQSVQKDTAKALSINWVWKLEPRRYAVSVKCLTQADETLNPAVKIVLESDSIELTGRLQVAAQQNKRPFTLYDVVEGERPSRANISPDGKYMLLRTLLVMSQGKQHSRVNIINVANGKTVLPGRDDWNWMPKGSRIYYTSDGSNGRKLTILDIATLQESVVAEGLPEGSFSWSPDEKFLIFAITDKAVEEKNFGVKQIHTPTDRQPGWRNRSFLYQYNLATGVLQPLVFGYRSASLLAVSPDAQSLIFSTRRDNFTERPFNRTSIYRLHLNSMKVDTLWQNIRYGTVACFSPDGQDLLLLGGPESFDDAGRDKLVSGIPNNYDKQAYIYHFADKQVKAITLDFKPSVEAAWWSAADNHIYFRTTDEDYVSLYRYLPKKAQFEKISLPADVLQNISFANETAVAVGMGQSVAYMSTVFKIDLRNKKTNILANPMKETMDQLELGKVQDWSTADKKIKGRVYYPHNFDKNSKYPMIVYYYGGTTPTSRVFDGRYPFYVYASLGYVVYVVQPSGTIGFGQEFSSRHVNAWGKRTADDIIEGVQQFCDAHQFVDRKKIGCMGASYGGFMTMYLQTKTDIFAAAVSHAGISDITSYWGEGYWGYSYNATAAADSYPWNNQDLFVGQSPLFSADKIKTPLLLLHGDADTNVPVGESIQMFTALKILGKPVELITVEGENHHILNYSKRIRWNNSIFAWFAKWLQDDDTWWKELYPEKKL